MPYAEFDTEVYFGIVADNMLRDHGQTALSLAGHALKKMKDIGDDEGFILWQGVQNQLMERVREYHIPQSATIH